MSSDDIVERLRSYASDPEIICDDVLIHAAADEITRLRALGDAMAESALRQRWSSLDVAVAAWQEARREQ